MKKQRVSNFGENMAKEGKCCRCENVGRITWANYAPYCDKCIAEKSKNAIPFEKAMFDDEDAYDEIQELKKRLDKLEKEVEELKKESK